MGKEGRFYCAYVSLDGSLRFFLFFINMFFHVILCCVCVYNAGIIFVGHMTIIIGLTLSSTSLSESAMRGLRVVSIFWNLLFMSLW